MKIKISSLSEGRHLYDFDIPASEIELPSDFVGNVTVQVKLEKTKDKIFITSEIQFKKEFFCDRCLTNYKDYLKTSYNMFYVYDIAHRNEYDEDVVTVISKDTDIIDLAPDVREYLLLAIPMKNICREDCKGLCPKCGQNLNQKQCDCEFEQIDPRWSELKKIYRN